MWSSLPDAGDTNVLALDNMLRVNEFIFEIKSNKETENCKSLDLPAMWLFELPYITF